MCCHFNGCVFRLGRRVSLFTFKHQLCRSGLMIHGQQPMPFMLKQSQKNHCCIQNDALALLPDRFCQSKSLCPSNMGSPQLMTRSTRYPSETWWVVPNTGGRFGKSKLPQKYPRLFSPYPRFTTSLGASKGPSGSSTPGKTDDGSIELFKCL